MANRLAQSGMMAQFSITHPDWNSGLEKLMPVVAARLGCEADSMSITLQGMAVCGPGVRLPYYSRTREGEVFTLVVRLPSIYKGGEVVVPADGRETAYDFGTSAGRSACMNHYAVHIGEVKNEVSRVSEGYCSVLIYSIHAKDASAITPPPYSFRKVQINLELQSLTRAFWIPLHRDYDEEDIRNHGICALKGIDRVQAEMLDHSVVMPFVAEAQVLDDAEESGLQYQKCYNTVGQLVHGLNLGHISKIDPFDLSRGPPTHGLMVVPVKALAVGFGTLKACVNREWADQVTTEVKSSKAARVA
ncbi:hypothetical protein HDU96_010617 [Phlyctochytrium bullatum]|nr:hypothetical protein HDU96_010617 [Phlyctochytrium bullatum]